MNKKYAWMTGLMLVSFVTVGIFLSIAPEQIPAHYDIFGNIDRWGSKYEHLLFPLFSAIMCIFMAVVARLERKKGNGLNETVVLAVGVWVQVLFNALWIFFSWKALQGTNLSGAGLSEKLILVLTMALLILLGNMMPRATRNSIFGLRTKWSMADDVCWQKSQRFGGYLLVCTGIVGVALISLLPGQWGAYTMLVLMIGMVAAAVLGSYRIYRGEQRKKA